MRKILPLLLSTLLSTGTYAQETIDQQVMQRIRTEAYEHSQVPFIASQLTDVSGPRLTNSPGYKKAARWAAQTLKQWGLQNATLEPWGHFGRGWSTEKVYAAIKTPYYQPLIAYPKAWSASTKGLVSGNVIILDQLTIAAIDKAGKNLKGKIVIIDNPDTLLKPANNAYSTRYDANTLDTLPDMYMIDSRDEIVKFQGLANEKAKIKRHLASKGILAVVSSHPGSRDGTIEVSGRAGYVKGQELPLTEVVLAKEDLLQLRRLVKANIPLTLELDIRNQWQDNDLQGYNVIADLPGTDPTLKDELVIIGGHLDSWHTGTGATDNGAGCIVMMEAIRILRSLNIQPKRTVRIALWGGEEQGLLGSFNYVKRHYGDPVNMQLTPAQQKVSAYYNLDNGSGKIRGIFLQNNDAVGPIFRSWLQPFADLDATGVSRNNSGSTDHLAFDAVGIPGFQFIQDPLEYETRTHHTNMDTYDHLAIDDLKQAATIVAAFVYNTAMREEKLPRKELPKPARFLFDLDDPL